MKRSYNASKIVRVACYVRVSSREQLQGWSIETQIDRCREYCDKKLGIGSYDMVIFRDEGESGRKGFQEPGARRNSYRPGLSDLRDRIAQGEFQVLIVSQLNRISRASRVWQELLHNYITPQNIEFISTKEDLDTSTAAGKFQASLLVDVAEYQAEEGAERVRMALHQRTKEGYPLGSRPYGWKGVPGDKDSGKRADTEKVPEEINWIEWMVEKYRLGWSLRTIAAELALLSVPAPMGGKVWHTQIINRTIFNPFHYGLVEHDGELIRGAHFDHRVFDPEVRDELIKVKNIRKKFPAHTGAMKVAPLAGLLTCANCGQRLYVVHPRGNYRGYRCDSNGIGAIDCETKPYVRGEFLEPRVIAEIEKLALDPATQQVAYEEAKRIIEESSSSSPMEILRIEKEISNIESKQRKWAELYVDGRISRETLTGYDEELAKQKVDLKDRLNGLMKSDHVKDSEHHLDQVHHILLNFPKLWDNLSSEERRMALDSVIELLSVDQRDGKIQVVLKLKLLPPVEFELPVVASWRRHGGEGRSPEITLRQLALLKELSEGNSIEDIRIKWRVGKTNVFRLRQKALAALGAKTIEEAIEKADTMLVEWAPYLRTSGRYGGSRFGEAGPKPLTAQEMDALRYIAAGWSDVDISSKLDVPITTVAGTRARIREKLLSHSTEEALYRAAKHGILSESDPSPMLLLKVYREIADGRHSGLVSKGIVKVPSALQLEVLSDFAHGIQLQETADRRRVSPTAIVTARQRIWAVVGGKDLRSALESVFTLGIISGDLVS